MHSTIVYIYLVDWLYCKENDEDPTLVPCNDLWEFDLELKKWTLLDDGSNYELDDAVPSPRFNHKLTVISSLSLQTEKTILDYLLPEVR